MIETLFYFVQHMDKDNYIEKVNSSLISPRTIVFSKNNKSIFAQGTQYGSMDVDDITNVLNQIFHEKNIDLPIATKDSLGAIIVGDYLLINTNGVTSIDVDNLFAAPEVQQYIKNVITNTITKEYIESSYVLSPATKQSLGGIIVGDYISVTPEGVLSIDIDTIAKTIVQNNNFTEKFENWFENDYSLPVASSSKLGGIKIGYPEYGKRYRVQLDSENRAFVEVPWVSGENNSSGGGSDHEKTTVTWSGIYSEADGDNATAIGTLYVDGNGTRIYAPVTSSSNGGGDNCGGENNSGIDTIARDKIDQLELDLANKWVSLNDIVEGRLTDLISDAEWLKANFNQGIIDWKAGWDDELHRYMSTVGYWDIDEDGNEIIKWSKLEQAIDAIGLQVAQLSLGGTGDTTALEGFVKTYIDAELQAAITELGALYAQKNAEDIIKWMYSSLTLGASENVAWSDLVVAANGGEGSGAISSLSQTVEEINGKYIAKGSLASALTQEDKDGIVSIISSAGFLTEASLEQSTSVIYSHLDEKYASISTVVTKDSNGKIESTVTLDADQINFDGQVFGSSDATFQGKVQASELVAGGISGNLYIQTTGDNIRFCDGNETLTRAPKGAAYFALENSQLLLYVWNEAESAYYRINFNNWEKVGDSDTELIQRFDSTGKYLINDLEWDVDFDSSNLDDEVFSDILTNTEYLKIAKGIYTKVSKYRNSDRIVYKYVSSLSSEQDIDGKYYCNASKSYSSSNVTINNSINGNSAFIVYENCLLMTSLLTLSGWFALSFDTEDGTYDSNSLYTIINKDVSAASTDRIIPNNSDLTELDISYKANNSNELFNPIYVFSVTYYNSAGSLRSAQFLINESKLNALSV